MTFFHQRGKIKKYGRRLLHVFTAYESAGIVRSGCGATFRYDEVKMDTQLPHRGWCWCKECEVFYLAEKVALKLGDEDGKRANGKMG